jgi:hypothetical protein
LTSHFCGFCRGTAKNRRFPQDVPRESPEFLGFLDPFQKGMKKPAGPGPAGAFPSIEKA